MNKINMNELFHIVEKTIKGIDLRIAIINEQGWKNVLTTFNFKKESVKDIKEIHRAIEEELQNEIGVLKIDLSNFKIIMKAISIKKFFNYMKKLKNKELRINNLNINYHEPFIIEDVDLKSGGSYIGDWEWLNYDFTRIHPQNANIFELFKLIKEDDLKRLGFMQGYNEVIAKMFGFDLNNQSIDIIINIPIYMKVNIVSYYNKSVDVEGYIHKKLPSIENIVRLEDENHNRLVKMKKFDLTTSDKTIYGEFIKWRNIIELPYSGKDNKLKVISQFCEKPSIFVQEYGDYIKYYLNHLEAIELPFSKLFNTFCNFDAFEEQLLDPMSYFSHNKNFLSKQKIRDQDIFERAVSWLLSMYGYSVIRLDEFQYLKSENGKARYNSADIIAYRRKTNTIDELLIISCTIGSNAVEKKFDPLNETFRKIQKLFSRKRIEIIPIIMTPTAAIHNKGKGKNYGIIVFIHNDLKDMLQKLRELKKYDFSNYINKFLKQVF